MGAATKSRINPKRLAWFAGLSVLGLAAFPLACASTPAETDDTPATGGTGATMSSGGAGTGGTGGATGGTTGGSAGQVAQTGGTGGSSAGTGGAGPQAGTGGTVAGGPAVGGSAGTGTSMGGAGAGGDTAASGGMAAGGSAGAAPTACAAPATCVAMCTETGGTVQPGACDGGQICCSAAQTTNPLAHLQESARTVGLLLANRFSKQTLSYSSVSNLPGDGYKNACEWYGALGVAKATSSTDLLTTLVTKFNPLKTNFVSNMKGGEKHVDRYIYGMVPLEIFIQTADESYKSLGTDVADDQQVTNQTRNAIDDMFMMTGLQVEAYRATKDAKYLNFMSKIMVDYLKAQQSNGLFFHNVTEAKVHWGRGNGWFAAGMAEMMRDLATDSGDYMTIEAGYKKMMAGLLPFQSANGLWYQVLDMPTNGSNWEESSGTAMFTYSMIAGVRRGVLDATTYVPVIEKAWAGLQKKINAQGDVADICTGTWYKASAAEYMALTRLTGDGHGQAPVLWAAAELLRP